MQLLTTSGRSVGVRERRWPMQGLAYPQNINPGYQQIKLTGTASGQVRAAVLSEVYRTNPWVYAAVQSIAAHLSRMPINTWAMQPDGQKERVRSDLPGGKGKPGADLDQLMRRPNPTTSPRRLIKNTLVEKIVYGDALWSKERDGNGDVIALWQIPWNRVTVLEGDTMPILGYEVRGAKNVRRFIPEDVVPFSQSDDPDSPLGVSPLSALKYTIALHEAIQRHLVAFFENQARPSGNLKLQAGANKDTIELIRDQVRDLYSAPENAGKVMVTTGDWQSITANADQSALIELAKLSREEIAAVFRIPPPILGILDRAIHSNVKELREQHVRDVIGPWAAGLQDDLDTFLVAPNPRWDGISLEFDLAESLKPDLEARATAYRNLAGVYTPNELRRMENLPDLDCEEANTVWLPSGAEGLGVEQPEQQGATGQAQPAVEPADDEGQPSNNEGDQEA